MAANTSTTALLGQRIGSGVVGLFGMFGVAWFIITMNNAELRKDDGDSQEQVTFEVAPPPKKKPPPKRKQRRKVQRKSAAKPPPVPIVGANLSGLSFGIESLEGGLGDDASSLLGDVSDAVMTADTVDELPRPVRQVKPEIPSRVRQKGIEGSVVVSLLIGVNGQVQNAKIVESRPPGVFDESVLNAVKQWTFQPAMYQGEPVSLRVDYPFKFKFN
ncbi:MAG: energy transducer TonB [Myxococcota bacterium]